MSDALTRLAASSSEAVVGILEMFAPGQVSAGDIAVADAAAPLEGVGFPAVATSVSYVDGVTGGNVFVMTLEGARRLAAAMIGGGEPDTADRDASELSELELSAMSEAMNQMMASAASAISSVLGTEVEIGPPSTLTFASAADAADAYPDAPHVVRASLEVCGEPCRLVQLVPNAFVVRMEAALDDIGDAVPAAPGSAPGSGSAAAVGSPSLAGIPVRVWAELGRASMPTADVVGLPPGAVVELDRSADEPIDLYVNGRRFATGRLLVNEGDEWAVRIETILSPENEPNPDA